MAREDPHFRLRIPSALKARIEDAAKENNRSINAEIVLRLSESFDEARASGGSGSMNVVLEALPAGSKPMKMTFAEFMGRFAVALKAEDFVGKVTLIDNDAFADDRHLAPDLSEPEQEQENPRHPKTPGRRLLRFDK